MARLFGIIACAACQVAGIVCAVGALVINHNPGWQMAQAGVAFVGLCYMGIAFWLAYRMA